MMFLVLEVEVVPHTCDTEVASRQRRWREARCADGFAARRG
jgi:hypothetical protein